MNASFWRGRRVLLTGHTGFKGSWLSLVLARAGAVVTGYALAPTGERNLFDGARVAKHVRSIIGDVRDLAALTAASAGEPEIILHLAAQSLVLTSYEAPLETFSTNVLGTANVLEAARNIPSVRAVVVVTTDKVYRNREWHWPYRDSFLAARGVGVATARAGNVIGGGDWADNRIVPDFVRATLAGQPLVVRNPESTRPWQHLLEPLEGYLLLAERLFAEPKKRDGAWNFGPSSDAVHPVGRLADDLVTAWGPGASWKHQRVEQPHEAKLLTLDATKARQEIGWTPRLGYARGVDLTVRWYKAFAAGADLEATTLGQIDAWLDEVGALKR